MRHADLIGTSGGYHAHTVLGNLYGIAACNAGKLERLRFSRVRQINRLHERTILIHSNCIAAASGKQLPQKKQRRDQSREQHCPAPALHRAITSKLLSDQKLPCSPCVT